MWIRDEDMIRGAVPMTKCVVRAATLALLDVAAGDVLLDIGAGTGSIAVQAALLGAAVYAVEQSPEGVALIRQNAAKFGVTVQIVHGSAPECLDRIPGLTACFIGGSAGKLEALVAAAHAMLPAGGRLAAAFITMPNMVIFTRLLEQYAYQRIERRLIQVADLDQRGMLRGQNPVCLAGGRKS